MAFYSVAFEIDIEAESPEEAAMLAQMYCLAEDNVVRTWTVVSEDGEERGISLYADGSVVEDDDFPGS